MNVIRNVVVVVAGLALHAGAHAAALGAGQPEVKEAPAPKASVPVPAPVPPVPPASAPVPVAAPRAEPATPTVTPVTNYPGGSYALTYSLDGDAGVSGHIMLGPRSAWVWGVTARWSDNAERYVGNAHETTESSNHRLDFATGYRRWSALGQTRVFVDTLVELGYRQRETEVSSNVSGAVDEKLTERDTVAGLSIALGFEYFFTPSVSVDGTVGAGFEYRNLSGSYVDRENNIDLDRSGHEKTLDLFDAGLRVNYYW